MAVPPTSLKVSDGHAETVLPVIEKITARGASLRQIATELTARSGKWHATTVKNAYDIAAVTF